MTDLISFGNHLRCGTYTLHSKFPAAANFFSDGAFAFIVDSRTGAGPLNIVLAGKSPDGVNSLEILNHTLRLDAEEISLCPSLEYDASIHLHQQTDRMTVKRNLGIFERFLVKYSPGKSLAFLVEEQRKAAFTSGFDLALVKRFEQGVRTLLDGEYRAGAGLLKGLGYGCTPAGDDFLSGFLLALGVCQQLTGADLRHVTGILYHSAVGGNIFVNTFLDCAARGQVSQDFQHLIHAVCEAGEKEIHSSALRVLSHGATSGADQAVGFLLGMKKYLP